MTRAARATDYLVTSRSGAPLSAFTDPAAAKAFRKDRAERGVTTRLFEVKTIRRELP